MTLALLRLAFAGLRSRLLATGLTVVLTAAASATLVIALEVGASGTDPWQRTFDAAHGAHVLALVPTADDARTLAALPGVVEHGEPVPSTNAPVTIAGAGQRLQFAAQDTLPTVNAPVGTGGARLPGAGIVLERSFARALHVALGARIDVDTPGGPLALTVVGTAVSPSQSRFPRENPGLGWVGRATLERIQPDQAHWQWAQALRLADPAAAPEFAATAAAALPPADRQAGEVTLVPWQQQRGDALLDSQPTTVVLGMFTILLLTVAFAVIGILTTARVAAQYREIGLLKAIGLTPRQVSAAFLAESAALGLVGVLLGFPAGAALAPVLAAPSAQTLIGSPRIAAQPWHALLASAVVLPVLLLSGALAVRRATRSSTLVALRAGTPVPTATGWTGRLIGRLRLPLATALGLKDLAARRRRTFWTATAVAVTSAVVVVTVQMRASIRPVAGGVSDVPAELTTLVYASGAVLVVIAATTLVAVMLLSVRERLRDLAILKAVGLTPGQVTASLVGAQAILAALASLLSVPLGIGLYLAVLGLASGSLDDAVLAPWWSVALVPVVTSAAVALTTSVPARVAAQIPVTDAVRYE